MSVKRRVLRRSRSDESEKAEQQASSEGIHDLVVDPQVHFFFEEQWYGDSG